MKARLTLAFALLLACTGAALAQTPDGMPPPLETVCDMETGAAYGLCNAYCEAMDCESDAPNASATACSKVRTKFQNITGRDVPCELTCPCTSIPEFTAILAGVNFCFELGLTHTLLSEGPNPPDVPYIEAEADTFNGKFLCGYVNFQSGSVIRLPLTPQEYTDCRQVLHNAAASRGVTCQ